MNTWRDWWCRHIILLYQGPRSNGSARRARTNKHTNKHTKGRTLPIPLSPCFAKATRSIKITAKDFWALYQSPVQWVLKKPTSCVTPCFFFPQIFLWTGGHISTGRGHKHSMRTTLSNLKSMVTSFQKETLGQGKWIVRFPGQDTKTHFASPVRGSVLSNLALELANRALNKSSGKWDLFVILLDLPTLLHTSPRTNGMAKTLLKPGHKMFKILYSDIKHICPFWVALFASPRMLPRNLPKFTRRDWLTEAVKELLSHTSSIICEYKSRHRPPLLFGWDLVKLRRKRLWYCIDQSCSYNLVQNDAVS